MRKHGFTLKVQDDLRNYLSCEIIFNANKNNGVARSTLFDQEPEKEVWTPGKEPAYLQDTRNTQHTHDQEQNGLYCPI